MGLNSTHCLRQIKDIKKSLLCEITDLLRPELRDVVAVAEAAVLAAAPGVQLPRRRDGGAGRDILVY